jgi:hypothetical protein
MATIEEPDAASNYNVTFDTVSPSRASLSIKRVVNSTIVGWATPVKVSYRAVGLRLVGRSAGSMHCVIQLSQICKFTVFDIDLQAHSISACRTVPS